MLKGKLHVDKLLTNFAVGYQPTGFIADEVLPIINVDKQSDMYDVWDQGDATRPEEDKRAPGTAPNNVRMGVSSDNFECKNYELGVEVTAEDVANADPSRKRMLTEGRVGFTKGKLMLGWEARLAALVMATANVGSSAAVSSVWTGVGANPVGDIHTAINNVHFAHGYRPNKMVINTKVMDALQRHVATMDKALNPNFSGAGSYPTAAEIAKIFRLEKILVGETFKNSSDEGIATSMTTVWPDHCLVYYDPAGSLVGQPRYGAVFNWAKAPTSRYQVVRHKVDTQKKKEDLSIGMYQDEKVVVPNLGFLLTTAI